MNKSRAGWRWFFLLAALEAGAAFVLLARVPRGVGGYSPTRLILLAVLGAAGFVAAWLAWRVPPVLERLVSGAAISLCASVALASAMALFFLRYLDPPAFAPIYDRLGILLWYTLAVFAQASILVLVLRYGFHPLSGHELRIRYLPALIALGALLLLALLVAATRLGLLPDSAYWGEPGVPIMGWQFGLAILGALIVLLIGLRLQNARRLDLWLVGSIWLAAVVIWLSVPSSVMRNSFYAPMSPPSLQSFPNSDAGYYDSMAESLLIGYPYQGDIPTRPLYIALLACLHLLVGERYSLIVAIQSLVLGGIPALAYLLGARLHSRAAGALIALAAIFRELTSLWVSSQTRVSNTKTLLVDLPTLMLVLAACLLVVRWLQRKDIASAVLAGGTFGILLLLRTQVAIIVPFVLIIAALSYGARSRTWITPLAVFVGACGLAVAPWLIHNYVVSGHLVFDAPFQYNIIASQYRYTGNLDIGNVDLQGKTLPEIMLVFALRDPKFVLGFISTHLLATQIDGLLALPLIEPFNGLRASINMYWLSWNGGLSWFNALLLVVYLALIAIGLGAAWRRLRWRGLAPLFFSVGYSLANGLGRFSGWRYDLPADWISYFYAGIGIAEILGALALSFGADARRIYTADPADDVVHRPVVASVLPILGFVVIGASPWLAQGIAQPRYAGQNEARLVESLSSASSVAGLGVSQAQIRTFVASEGATLQVGRILYPRFFTRGDGLASAHPWPAYAPRDFPRLGFVLLNETRHDVILPARQAPAGLLHASDAIVLGCVEPDYVEARLILLPELGVAYLGEPLDTPCP